jgi:hypothetical protein
MTRIGSAGTDTPSTQQALGFVVQNQRIVFEVEMV